MDASRVLVAVVPAAAVAARRDARGSGATTARAGATASARRQPGSAAAFARRWRSASVGVPACPTTTSPRGVTISPGSCAPASSLASALRSATPAPRLAPIVAPIGLALDRGDSVAGATRRVASDDASVDLALGVVRACADLGGPAAQPLDRAASTLRARAADLAERQVAQRPGPPVGDGAHPAPGRRPGPAPGNEPGRAGRGARRHPASLCLGAGAALNASGWWWMRRIIGRSP